MDTTTTLPSDPPTETEASAAPDVLQPIPTPFSVNDQGKPVPLPGAVPVFLTGTTVDILGLQPPSPADGAAPPTVVLITIQKEKLLGDIQFRGAISDFHALKSKIQAADYDTIVLRYLEDDVYGEGCNYEVAVTQQTASTWQFINTETERQQQIKQQAVAEAAVAKRVAKQRGLRPPKPWQDLGSEAEIQEHAITSSRPPAQVLLVTKRRGLRQPAQLGDKDAHELWSSTANECRPFKDPAYDLRRAVRDSTVQETAATRDVAIQATGGRPRPGAVQYNPRDMSEAERQQHLASTHFHKFLQNIEPRCELALLQNEVVDILADELAVLGEDDDQQQHVAASATAAAGSGAAVGRKERGLSEVQSFTDLAYSKGKTLSALQWLPHRRGVAVSCTEPLPFSARIEKAGWPSSHYILFWNFRDSIHPELVLEAPSEVFCFAFNPDTPAIVAAGCYNGQVVLWDLTGEWDRVMRQAAGGKVDEGSEEATIPVIRHKFTSAVEHSHNTMVTDLQWLPGLEFGSGGRLQPSTGSRPTTGSVSLKAAANAAVAANAMASAGAAAGAAAAGSQATPAAPASSQQPPAAPAKACHVLATTASDGKVLFWDSRVERLLKKGRRVEDPSEVVWKPSHSMHLLSAQGMDLQAARLCFDPRNLESGTFCIGSAEGELVSACFIKQSAQAGGEAGSSGGGEAPSSAITTSCSHCGAIVAVQRSPFLEDVLLTVGDWSFQIWREGDPAPLFVSPYAQESYTGGCWSPSRAAVILLTDASGGVEVWDLLDRSHTPVLRTAAASSALSSVSLQAVPMPGSGAVAMQLLAVGDSAGTLRILELPKSLRRQVHNEKKSMSAWIARAAAGVEELAARAPIRAAVRKQMDEEAAKAREAAALAGEASSSNAAAGAGAAAGGGPATPPAAAAAASPLPGSGPAATRGKGAAGKGAVDSDEAWEAEYLVLEKAFKGQLGLVPAKA